MSGNNVLSTTHTGITGIYNFQQLQPGSYTVCFSLPAGYTFTVPGTNQSSDQDSNASLETGCSASVTLSAGEYNPTIDAGVINNTTAVQLALFEVQAGQQEGRPVIRVRWQTALESDTYGFHILRSQTNNVATAIVLNPDMLAAQGRNGGASYEWLDTGADTNTRYFYWLREIELSGRLLNYGPATYTPDSAPAHTNVALGTETKSVLVAPAPVPAGGQVMPTAEKATQAAPMLQSAATQASLARQPAAQPIIVAVVTVQSAVVPAQSENAAAISNKPAAASSQSGKDAPAQPALQSATDAQNNAAPVADTLAQLDSRSNDAIAVQAILLSDNKPALETTSAKSQTQSMKNARNAGTTAPSVQTIIAPEAQASQWQQETQRLMQSLIIGVALVVFSGICMVLALTRRRSP